MGQTSTTTYRITNRISGQELGVYGGASPEEAIEAMHADAGYEGSADAAKRMETTVEALRAELIVEEVAS